MADRIRTGAAEMDKPLACPFPFTTPDARRYTKATTKNKRSGRTELLARGVEVVRSALRPPPGTGEIDAAADRSNGLSRTADAGRCFPCHSPTLRPWIAVRRPTWRGFGARVSARSWKNCTLKRTQVFQRVFQRDARGVFLSQAGPRFDLNLFKLSITSVSIVGAVSETTKATRWIALDWLVMRLGD